jgi:hypothetical protein
MVQQWQISKGKKGNPWYFGRKAHAGVDSKTKIIHSAVVMAANIGDSAALPDLLQGDETKVWGDQASRTMRSNPRDQNTSFEHAEIPVTPTTKALHRRIPLVRAGLP